MQLERDRGGALILGRCNLRDVIEPEYVVTMAAYNRWQNENLYDAANTLSDAARREDRGAFFGSIHATLNHVLWADEVWLGRFTGRPFPKIPVSKSPLRYPDWSALTEARSLLDRELVEWAEGLSSKWLREPWEQSTSSQERPSQGRSRAFYVVHLFHHQTHHRGQVHAMLTAAGAKPGDTDLLKIHR